MWFVQLVWGGVILATWGIALRMMTQLSHATSAPQVAAVAAESAVYCILPYVFARAVSALAETFRQEQQSM